mgnify:CR=1 FL=1
MIAIQVFSRLSFHQGGHHSCPHRGFKGVLKLLLYWCESGRPTLCEQILSTGECAHGGADRVFWGKLQDATNNRRDGCEGEIKMKYLAIFANFIALGLVGWMLFTRGIPNDEEVRLFAAIGAATVLSLWVLYRHRPPDAKYQKWLDDEAKRLRSELAEDE